MVKFAALREARLLQLRVLRLGFLQDGDVGVGVFPEGEPTHRMPMPATPIALLVRAPLPQSPPQVSLTANSD